ncbi:MAG: GNAT family N-acetyltransferase, partial [Lachnospiraceae bacterium]|nr:GNAT family N-acetyltransferase [Lachnospiraceae bacterium]
MVREIKENELQQLLELYLHLHETSVPEESDHLKQTWQTIMQDSNHHIIVKIVDGQIVSSCVCV